MRNILNIVFHCSGANPKQTVESIKNYWKTPPPKGNGWKQVGYHHLVDYYGIDHQLASDEVITNGVAGHNSNSIHISYIGGENGIDTRTPEQKVTLEKLLRYYHAKYPKAKILGHRDFAGVKKSCPSFPVAKWIKDIGL